jgi:hypothetical protein
MLTDRPNEERLECGHALCLQGCIHFIGQRERVRERKIEREREKKEGGRDREKVRESEKEGETDVEYVQPCYFFK